MQSGGLGVVFCPECWQREFSSSGQAGSGAARMCSVTQGWMIEGVKVQYVTWAKEVCVMRSLDLPHGGVWWGRQIRDPQVMVSLVAAACLLVEAVIAKNVIDVELDFFTQLAPMWIFIVYQVSGLRDRTSEIAFIAVIILATAAILVLYAV
ncbi:MAG: hypothetical protein ACXW0R_08055 [Gaiellaceae bacterium]